VSGDSWLDAFLIGSLAFAGGGAALAWVVCRTLRGVLPGLSRRGVLAIVAASVPALIILVIGLIGHAIEGFFSLSFVLTMQWQGWVFMLVATATALLLARRLAPAPRAKVDPSVFE
jgi:hypothetical protein